LASPHHNMYIEVKSYAATRSRQYTQRGLREQSRVKSLKDFKNVAEGKSSDLATRMNECYIQCRTIYLLRLYYRDLRQQTNTPHRRGLSGSCASLHGRIVIPQNICTYKISHTLHRLHTFSPWISLFCVYLFANNCLVFVISTDTLVINRCDACHNLTFPQFCRESICFLDVLILFIYSLPLLLLPYIF